MDVQQHYQVQRTVPVRVLDIFQGHLLGKNFCWNVRNSLACAASNVYVEQTRMVKSFSC